MFLQVWGSLNFVFNIGYVCYKCGDRHTCLLYDMFTKGKRVCRFLFNIGYVS